MKNVLISFESGDNVLIYTETLSVEECKEFAIRASKRKDVDVYELRDDELQYYCIDDRIWIDTPEKESALRRIISL